MTRLGIKALARAKNRLEHAEHELLEAQTRVNELRYEVERLERALAAQQEQQ